MSPTPRTPLLSPYVSRFLLCELTNAHKKEGKSEEVSPSQDGSNTPAVPRFDENKEGIISPMLLEEAPRKNPPGKDTCKEVTRGRKNLLKQATTRNSNRLLEEKEGETLLVKDDEGMRRGMPRRRGEAH